MHIVAIAWLYVTLLMAFSETGIVSGVITFLLYGLAPLALLLWLWRTPQRRRRRLAQPLVVHEVVPDADRGKPESDQ